jgi:hypothetical protein
MPTIIGNSQGRDGDIRIRATKSGQVVEETYSFIVRGDFKSQPREEIILTNGLPRVNISASAGGFTVCKSIDASRRPEQPLIWDIKATFSSEVEEGSQTSNPVDEPPTAWVPVYETKFERLQEVVSKDKDGDTIANSAGVPFEVGLTVTRFIPVWHFWQFDPATVTDEQVLDRNETTNSATFKGRVAKSLLCTIESSSVGFYYGQRLRLTYYSLKYNKKLWTNKRLDVGTSYLDSGTLKDYTTSDGQIILGSLNGSGAKQAVGTPPAVLEFDVFEPVDFNTFLRI